MKKISKIGPQYQVQGLKWITLEQDHLGSGGVFLFLHQNLNEPCIFDYWFETIQQAEQEALKRWGISKEDWEDAVKNSDEEEEIVN